MLAIAVSVVSGSVYGEDTTVCARVKIEVKQELTLERQAFDAEMRINNTTDTGIIENVSVVVKVTDEAGTPVEISSDPNNQTAKFFVRISNIQNIAAVDGTGQVNPQTTAVINWLLIPAPGSADENPAGKKYLVGATLQYRFAGENTVLEVSPDVITVKPLPLLTLDYFLTQGVEGDDPLTRGKVEPEQPFTLGVRVQNNGHATAKNLKIESAQPRIVENEQGLLINFNIIGSYVNDAPAQNTLLIDFGDIAASTSKMGRWIMMASLAGTFTDFTARFTHADELGGTLTSILEATNAHFLMRDVRVDLPGRDTVKDFLAIDAIDPTQPDFIRVYESDGPDTLVTNRSDDATLIATSGSGGSAGYSLNFPPTDGFVYIRKPDPFNGQKALEQVLRSDGKTLLPENVWLSRTRDPNTHEWQYWVNFFDVNSSGAYGATFADPPAVAQPPVIQFIQDHVVDESQNLSFTVEASSPDGRPVMLTAEPLPTGASFTQLAGDPQNPGLANAVFDWTPADGQAEQDGQSQYLIVYTATDDRQLSATRSATITVDQPAPPIPGTPAILGPGLDSELTTVRPTLIVRNGTEYRDRTVQQHFEIYADEAMTQLADSAQVEKGSEPQPDGSTATNYLPAQDLNDNAHYWWRVRSFDGDETYSPWSNGRFFTNLFNDPPETFNLSSPAGGVEVDSALPILSWSNTTDVDEDEITYAVYVYSDEALTQVFTSKTGLAPDASGSTSWTVDREMTNHATYYWKAVAKDEHDAITETSVRSLIVNTGNTAPVGLAIVSPVVGSEVPSASTPLTVQNATDGESDPITYVFELDSVASFDSNDKRISGVITAGGGGNTSWTVAELVENQKYWWRAKAQDGRAETAWVQGNFRKNAANDPPPTPTVANPGNGAWVASLTPTFEANPVEDPEEQAVSYQFQVFSDAGLTTQVASGSSSTTAWEVTSSLTDKTTHWWHVRAVDASGAPSDWSLTTVLYVSTGQYQNPTIQLSQPAIPLVPTDNGGTKTATIAWEATDNNIEPTIRLFYSTERGSFSGQQIGSDVQKPAGTSSGTYEWNVTSLSPGVYYVYGQVTDPKGTGQNYAPGAVVVPTSPQNGSIVANPSSGLVTTEAGGQAQFNVRLGAAPVADVTFPVNSTNPREGVPSVASLTFTPQNWSTDQPVTVTGVNDCLADGSVAYAINLGPVVAEDPDYIQITGGPVTVTNNTDANADGKQTTNMPGVIYICNFKVVAQRQVDLLTREWDMTAELMNLGPPLNGVTATLTGTPLLVDIIDAVLEFGAVDTGETVKTTDTFTVRSVNNNTPSNFNRQDTNVQWNVTTE